MDIEDYGSGQAADADVVVVTTNEVPGCATRAVLGEVFGLTVRSRNAGSKLGSAVKSVVGGELRGLTKVLVQTRNEAMERLIEQARAKGANAVLAFRYDVTDADFGTEVCAYGTAATVDRQP